MLQLDNVTSLLLQVCGCIKEALASVVSAAVVKATDNELRKLNTLPSSCGPYAKVSSEQHARIAKYTSMHGNVSPTRQLSKELGIVVKRAVFGCGRPSTWQK